MLLRSEATAPPEADFCHLPPVHVVPKYVAPYPTRTCPIAWVNGAWATCAAARLAALALRPHERMGRKPHSSV